ncbi:helix-turn-helix domain-containing protein [Metabacillus fastidiosus]|uniref:helix-turn-helix domain-containing protein n=1 Tax=Metabacillus fastidiosus TaxID=1458 RepID=UPI003D28FF21
MTKYSLETKLLVVHAYLNGVESLRDTAQKYNVSYTMLQKWVARSRESGTLAAQEGYTNYSLEFKMDVLNCIEKTGASIEEATLIYNIPSSSTVWTWKYLLETQGIDALKSKEKGRPSMKKESSKKQAVERSEEALLAEIERLRMENAYLKKLNALVQEERKSQSVKKRK